MIDPVDGTAYLLTKTLPEPAELYHYPLPFDSSKVKTLQKDGVYPGLGQWVTAGDVSSDGRVRLSRKSALDKTLEDLEAQEAGA